MAQTAAQKMKAAINVNLQTLANTGVLQSYIQADYTKASVFDFNFPSFPSAVVLPPTISTSEYEDQATNNREYEWNILIVTNPNNMPTTDPTYLEGLIDNILNVFDLDCTLQGSSIAAVMPAVLAPPGPVSNGALTFVVFYVSLKARTLVPAGVQ